MSSVAEAVTTTENTVLKPVADRQIGGFVKTLQGSTGVGFQEGFHVHKDWYAKTLSFDQGLALVEDAVRNREDIKVTADNLSAGVSNGGKFVLVVLDSVGSKREFVPTDHCLQHLSTKINLGSASVLREMRGVEDFDSVDAETMAKMVNNSMRRVKGSREFFMRTYTDGTARALLSDRYAPIDNRWYLEVLREFLPDARLSHWSGDEDTIYGNLLLPDSMIHYDADDSDYGAMVSVGNCEVGKRTVSQRPSLFRSICLNGCIWGERSGNSIKRRHVGTINLESLKVEIGKNIAEQLPLFDGHLQAFLATRERGVGHTNMRAIIGEIAQSYSITKPEAVKVFDTWERYESDNASLFGVLNAITRIGQQLGAKRWVEFDEIGGQLVSLEQNRWEKIVSRARDYTTDDYKKAFGSGIDAPSAANYPAIPSHLTDEDLQ